MIGAKLLEYVLETAKKDSTIIEVYLHVQVIILLLNFIYINLCFFAKKYFFSQYCMIISKFICFFKKESFFLNTSYLNSMHFISWSMKVFIFFARHLHCYFSSVDFLSSFFFFLIFLTLTIFLVLFFYFEITLFRQVI